MFQARDEGALDPVRPLLVLPEVADESKWFGGFDGLYADKEKQYLPRSSRRRSRWPGSTAP